MMRRTNTRPLVVTFLIILFAIGTVASLFVVITLMFPGSFLDVAWRVNPRAYEGFTRIGSWSLVLMSGVFVACLFTAIGLWRRFEWGYWLAMVMLIANLTADDQCDCRQGTTRNCRHSHSVDSSSVLNAQEHQKVLPTIELNGPIKYQASPD